tara:strand:+ start:138 stop:1226 length:1089 start_codon:yes stop_codon:yes gene_type:complete
MNNKIDKKIQDCIKAIGINDTEEYKIYDRHGDVMSSGGETASECLYQVILNFAHKIVDVDYFHSGGGLYHMFMHLESGHIISFHDSEHDFEVSYNKWGSIDAYYNVETRFTEDDLELVDFEGGMGHENKCPNYNQRYKFLMDAFKSMPNFLDTIDMYCSREYWSPSMAIVEGLKNSQEELDYIRDEIVNDWFQNFEKSNKEMTDEYNEACDVLRVWNDRKTKLDVIENAIAESEECFNDCIEYTNPTIREAFKSRGFVDGTWRNSICPSFELWIDEESPITKDILYVVYFPNLTRDDNPSELQDEQYNYYSIELKVSGDNVICGTDMHEEGLYFETYEDVLGFFYSNTTLYNYKLAIDKEVQ